MTPPRIAVSEEAKEWLLARGGALTLRYSLRHGCCGGSAELPVADPEAPAEREVYEKHWLDGLDIYIANDFAANGREVRVSLEGFWKWRRLTVDGAEIASGRDSEKISAR